ncbi:hypothetical protein PAHAL_1G028400 [Panicum hallii]|uniref:Uncharacterized protein n=1 Tax=Panicum hallii TaxID=206008 RepID=A0A2S3GKZ0_9POAL|nr:uncharacterized protein LOC112879739 isoform X2 [Panicum hallii]PAN03907.1 hypothetical protein PAHAL_1G028400 [Panicum hallii]PVH65579.1 hypothetical protein PAHAL_1G028400 [Panicum hallii]
MADKPSRALVLYAAGHAALLTPTGASSAAAGSHLDAFASRASCGFLTLRSPPTSPSTTGAEENSSTILELAQLLDVYDHLYPGKEVAQVDPQELVVPKLSERFMGLRAAMVTNCPRISSFAANLGFHVFQTNDFAAQFGSSSVTKEVGVINRAFGLLGFSDGNVQEASEFDLVFMHVAMENTSSKLGKLGMKADLNRLEKLVGAIMDAAPIGSAIASRIHVSLILSYGSASGNKDEFSILTSSTETDSDLNLLRPRQSYTMKAGHALEDVRLHHPILLAQWQEGVTRVDLVKVFSFEEFMKHGGNLAMLAERFLPEVAFKLWKAPKYGA